MRRWAHGAATIAVTLALIAAGGCDNDRTDVDRRATAEASASSTTASRPTGDGALARTFPTIEELARHVDDVVIATATDLIRSGTEPRPGQDSPEYRYTGFDVHERLKGDASGRVEVKQIPAIDAPFQAGRRYVLFLVSSDLPDSNPAVFGAFGQFEEGAANVFTDRDPHSDLSPSLRTMKLEDLRAKVAAAG